VAVTGMGSNVVEPIQVSVDETQLTRLIELYLEERSYAESAFTLERESGVNAHEFGQDMAYIREFVLGGDYVNLRQLLSTLKKSLGPSEAQRIEFAVGKQEFLELLVAGSAQSEASGSHGDAGRHSSSSTARVEELVNSLKPLEGLCSADEFNMLCYALTLPALTDLPEYADWTVHAGRQHCFNEVASALVSLFPGQMANTRVANGSARHALLSLIEQGIRFQVLQNHEARPDAELPGEVVPDLLNANYTVRGDHVGDGGGSGVGGGGSGGSGGVRAHSADPHPSLAQTAPASAFTGAVSASMPVPAAARAAVPVAQQGPLDAQRGESAGAKGVGLGGGGGGGVQADEALLEHDAVTVMQPGCPVRTVAFSPDGEHFIVGTNDRSLHICSVDPSFWDSRDGRLPDADPDAADGVEEVRTCAEHHLGSVYCSTWNADGTLIASGSNDKRVRVVEFHATYDPDTCVSSLFDFDGHTGTVRDLCFDEDATLTSAGAGDCIVRRWDVVTGQATPVMELQGHQEAVWSVRVAEAARGLAMTAAQDGVKVWDLRSAQHVHDLYRSAMPRASEFVAGSDHHVVSTYDDGQVLLWDTRQADEPCAVVYTHEQEVRGVEFSSDGALMVTASFDGVAGIHALLNGETGDAPHFQLECSLAHPGRVLQARPHPHRPHAILTCTANSDVNIWVPRTSAKE